MSRVIGLKGLFLIVLTGRGIVLKNANNVEITSGKLSLSHITIYEITNPRKGAWTLTVPGSNGDHEFSVKSSSDSNVDFDHYFLITLSWRRRSSEVPVSNPVVGKPVSFLEVDKIFRSQLWERAWFRLPVITFNLTVVLVRLSIRRSRAQYTSKCSPKKYFLIVFTF